MQDRDGALWLGMDSGVARVETPSPVSYFAADDGIPGTVNYAIRHRGRFFVATQTSVAILEPAQGARSARFVPIPGLNVQQCWWFAEMLDPAGVRPPTLAVACTSGLNEITATGGRPITDPRDLTVRPAVLLASKVDPTRLWVGMFEGLMSARLVNGQWSLEGLVDGITEQVRSLYEDADGNLWLGTQEGLARFDGARFVNVDAGDGLPDPRVLALAGDPRPGAEGALWVGTRDGGLVYLDRDLRPTVFDTTHGLPAGAVAALVAEPTGRVWVGTREGLCVLDPPPVPVQAADDAAIRCTSRGLDDPYVRRLARGTGGVIWIGTRAGLHRLQDGTIVSLAARHASLAPHKATSPFSLPARALPWSMRCCGWTQQAIMAR